MLYGGICMMGIHIFDGSLRYFIDYMVHICIYLMVWYMV
jgi:hypothetical protein